MTYRVVSVDHYNILGGDLELEVIGEVLWREGSETFLGDFNQKNWYCSYPYFNLVASPE